MYELRVLTGLHRGAALPLIGQQWNLGNEEDADLVLFDPGIKPQHCCLVQLENGWELEGSQGKITDAEGHKVDKIEHLSVNASFALNGVWMTIVDASTPWSKDESFASDHNEPPTAEGTGSSLPKAAKKTNGKALVNFILGFVCASAIVATSTWASLRPSKSDMEDNTPETAVTEAQPIAADLLPKLTSTAEVKNQLRSMLRERELDNAVQIKTRDKQILVTGAIDDMDRERVHRMLNRFHRQFSTPINIANHTTELSENLPFKIMQITSGPMGSVITNTGKRLFVGDELNGMRLVSVSDNKIIFKGKQDYEVKW